MTNVTVASSSHTNSNGASQEPNFDAELNRLFAPISEYFSETTRTNVNIESEELERPSEQTIVRPSFGVSFDPLYHLLGDRSKNIANESTCDRNKEKELQSTEFQEKWETMKQTLEDGYTAMKTLAVVGESVQFLFDVLKSVEDIEPLLSGSTNNTSPLPLESNNSIAIKLQDAEADRLSNCLSKLQKLYMEFDHSTLDLRSTTFASMVQELHDTCGSLRTFPLAPSVRQEHYRRAAFGLEKVYNVLRNGVQAAMVDAERAIFVASVLQEATGKLSEVFHSSFEDNFFSSPETMAKHVDGWTSAFSFINELYLDKMDESAPLRRYLELLGDDLREFGDDSASGSMPGAQASSSAKEILTLRPLFHMYISQRSKLLKLLLRCWLYQVKEGENEKVLASLEGYLKRTSPTLEYEAGAGEPVTPPMELGSSTLPTFVSTPGSFCCAVSLHSFIEETAVAIEAFLKQEKKVADRVWLRHDFQLAVLPPLNAALADASYSVFRSRLLAEDDVQELSKGVERIETVRTYCNTKRWVELPGLWMRMMQDTQERLIFRASIYLRQDLAWNSPTKEWGEKYKNILNELEKSKENGAADTPPLSSSGSVENSHTGEANGAPEQKRTAKEAESIPSTTVSIPAGLPVFEYIPTFPLAIGLLRSLHGSLTSDVFSVLAEEAIRLCLTQIKQLSRIMHSTGFPDEELLALLVEIAHLHYLHHYVSLLDAKITVVEKKIDLSQSLRYRKIKIAESSRESIESVENQFADCYRKLVEVIKNNVSLHAHKSGETEEEKRATSAKVQRLTQYYESLLLCFVPDQWLRAKILLPVYQFVESYKSV